MAVAKKDQFNRLIVWRNVMLMWGLSTVAWSMAFVLAFYLHKSPTIKKADYKVYCPYQAGMLTFSASAMERGNGYISFVTDDGRVDSNLGCIAFSGNEKPEDGTQDQ